jgi:polar amino acid transport system substrate-binding protein
MNPAPLALAACLAFVALGCAGCVEQHPDRLLAGVPGGREPHAFIDEDGELAGFEIDLIRAMCETMKRDCLILMEDHEPAELLRGLEGGRWDMVCVPAAQPAELAAGVEFSEPFYRARMVYVGRTIDQGRYDQDELDNVRIAATGGGSVAWIEREHPEALLVPAADTAEAFALLARHKVDLVLTDNLTALDFLRSEAGRIYDMIGDPLPVDELVHAPSLAVSVGRDGLRRALDRALAEIRLNGVHRRIARTYFPIDVN